MGRRHGPGSLHPPHREGVTEPFVSHVAAAGHLAVHFVALQHLVQEVYVSRGQLQCLYLAELIRRQRRDDLPQGCEGFVQRLCALPLPDVGQNPLVLQLLVGVRATRTRLLGPLNRNATAVLALLFAGSPFPALLLLLPVCLLLTIHRRDRGAGTFLHSFFL